MREWGYNLDGKGKEGNRLIDEPKSGRAIGGGCKQIAAVGRMRGMNE
jgi:hypothetical protein